MAPLLRAESIVAAQHVRARANKRPLVARRKGMRFDSSRATDRVGIVGGEGEGEAGFGA